MFTENLLRVLFLSGKADSTLAGSCNAGKCEKKVVRNEVDCQVICHKKKLCDNFLYIAKSKSSRPRRSTSEFKVVFLGADQNFLGSHHLEIRLISFYSLCESKNES